MNEIPPLPLYQEVTPTPDPADPNEEKVLKDTPEFEGLKG
jgi:hypothetical protein